MAEVTNFTDMNILGLDRDLIEVNQRFTFWKEEK